jgi:hypothetical protein
MKKKEEKKKEKEEEKMTHIIVDSSARKVFQLNKTNKFKGRKGTWTLGENEELVQTVRWMIQRVERN